MYLYLQTCKKYIYVLIRPRRYMAEILPKRRKTLSNQSNSTQSRPNTIDLETEQEHRNRGGGAIGKSVCLACVRLGVRIPAATDPNRKTR